VQRSEDVYALVRDRLLEVVEEGFDLALGRDLRERLGGGSLPQTVAVLFEDMQRRAGSVWEVGPAVLLRCSEPFVAQLIGHDKTLRKLCLLAADNHLVVPAESLPALRRGVKRLGYVVGTGEGSSISRA
jgi:hypothetical protein